MLFEVKRQHSLPHLLFIWKQIACLCEGRRPGVARHASNFLSRRRKKVTKERATLLSATPSLRCGATWGARGCTAELAARLWRSARTTAVSQITKHARSDAHATPRPARPRRIQKGTRGSGHPHGPLLRSAPSRGRKRHALRRQGRAQRWPEGQFGCSDVLLPHPCWLRLRRGGCGVAWASKRPCLVNGLAVVVRAARASAKRVPRRTPQPPRRRFAP